VLALQGHLGEATGHARAGLDQVMRRRLREHPAACGVLLALAEVAAQHDEPTEAFRLAQEVDHRLAAEPCDRMATAQRATAKIVLAGVRFRCGDARGALRTLEEAHPPIPGPVMARLIALRARALLRIAPPAEAATVLRQIPIGPDTILAHAEVAAAAGDQPMVDAVARWRSPEWPAVEVVSLVAQANVAVAHRLPEARRLLDQAVAKAADQCLWASFATLAEPLTELLRRSARARAILSTLANRAPSMASTPVEEVPLTPREVTVVRALATDAPLREIAAELYISPNTLKSHTRHLYRKLEVCNRAGAVAAAQAMGLLGLAPTGT
jgi:LuxR family maltose regulon positive regulatory protein